MLSSILGVSRGLLTLCVPGAVLSIITTSLSTGSSMARNGTEPTCSVGCSQLRLSSQPGHCGPLGSQGGLDGALHWAIPKLPRLPWASLSSPAWWAGHPHRCLSGRKKNNGCLESAVELLRKHDLLLPPGSGCTHHPQG